MKRAVDDGLRDALNKYDAKGNVWKDQIDYLQSEVRSFTCLDDSKVSAYNCKYFLTHNF